MKLRNKKEISDAEERLSELAWFFRFMYGCLSQKLDPKKHPGWESAKRIVNKHENIDPLTDHQLGELYGRINALRWVLGEDWDNLAVL